MRDIWILVAGTPHRTIMAWGLMLVFGRIAAEVHLANGHHGGIAGPQAFSAKPSSLLTPPNAWKRQG